MTLPLPTRGQLERSLEQRVRTLYRDKLGQKLNRVTCQFFDEKVVIVLEGATTLSEQLLLKADQQEFTEELRERLDRALTPELKSLIVEVMGVEVMTILKDSQPENGFSSITAILYKSPLIRDTQPTRSVL